MSSRTLGQNHHEFSLQGGARALKGGTETHPTPPPATLLDSHQAPQLLGGVEMLEELFLVHFPHLVARDLLHHEQVRGDGVRCHGLPGTHKHILVTISRQCKGASFPQPQPL